MENKNISIACICETKWSKKYAEKMSQKLGKWRFFTKTRDDNHIGGAQGGGLAIIYHKSLSVVRHLENKLISTTSEILAVQICTTNSKNLRIISAYNRPQDCVTINGLKKIAIRQTQTMVLGDLNGKSPVWCNNTANTSKNGEHIIDLIDSKKLHVLNNGDPTYFCNKPGTMPRALDLTLVTHDLTNSTEWCTLNDFDSDHTAILITPKGTTIPVIARKFIPKWRLKTADTVKYHEGCTSTFNGFLQDHQGLTLHELENAFSKKLYNVALQTIGLTSEGKHKPKSWWTKRLSQLFKKRKRLSKKWRRTRREIDRNAYKLAAEKFTAEFKIARDKGWEKICQTIQKKSGPLQFKVAARLMGKTSQSIRPLTMEDGKKAETAQEIANIFQKQFENVSKSGMFTHNKEQSEINAFVENHKNDFGPCPKNPIPEIYASDTPFTRDELSAALKILRISSPGRDKIHNWLLKNAPECVQIILLHIYNRSFAEGNLADTWRKADVIPIPKPGKDPTSPASYRPISLLSCIGKLMERLVYNRVSYIAETQDILSVNQAGFRRRKSTIDQLLRLTQAAKLGGFVKEDVITILLDISRAYDRMWPNGLRYKLYQLGYRGRLLRWMSDFLRGRIARVLVGDTASQYSDAYEMGVPQGSVLSTILFNLFINDASQCIINSVISIFADDMGLWISTKDDFRRAASLINQDLVRLGNWALKWRVTFSIPKCVSTMFTLHPYRRKEFELKQPIQLFGQVLKYQKNPRFLGLHFDPRLSWKYHFTQIIETAKKRICMIRRLMNGNIPRRALTQLYKCTVLPTFTYGSEVWCNASNVQLKRLSTAQNKGLRVVTGAFPGTAIGTMEADTQIWPLQKFFDFKILKKYFKIHGLQRDLPLYALLSDYKNTLAGPRARLRLASKGKKSFFANCNAILRRLNIEHPADVEIPLLPTSPPWSQQNLSPITDGMAKTRTAFAIYKNALHTEIITEYLNNPKLAKYRMALPSYPSKIRGRLIFSFRQMRTLFRLKTQVSQITGSNVMEEEKNCQACNTRGGVVHTLLHCPTHNAHRQELEDKVSQIAPSLDFNLTTLFGLPNVKSLKLEKISTAVLDFIKKSKIKV
jgi:hypothetical protein